MKTTTTKTMQQTTTPNIATARTKSMTGKQGTTEGNDGDSSNAMLTIRPGHDGIYHISTQEEHE